MIRAPCLGYSRALQGILQGRRLWHLFAIFLLTHKKRKRKFKLDFNRGMNRIPNNLEKGNTPVIY